MTERVRADGFTYIECMAALALVGIALTMSLTLLQHRSRHLRTVEERIHALHVVEAEIELLRSLPASALASRTDAPLVGDWAELGTLPGATGRLTIARTGVAGVHRGLVVVTWIGSAGPRRQVAEVLLDGRSLPLERAR